MLFNRQIMNYLGSDALAVFGVIVQVSGLVQCFTYGDMNTFTKAFGNERTTTVHRLPALFGAKLLWWVMPITEFAVAIYTILCRIKNNRSLNINFFIKQAVGILILLQHIIQSQ